jgi:hypothetical protein
MLRHKLGRIAISYSSVDKMFPAELAYNKKFWEELIAYFP